MVVFYFVDLSNEPNSSIIVIENEFKYFSHTDNRNALCLIKQNSVCGSFV